MYVHVVSVQRPLLYMSSTVHRVTTNWLCVVSVLLLITHAVCTTVFILSCTVCTHMYVTCILVHPPPTCMYVCTVPGMWCVM
jgi:hypothetical protein